MSEGLENVIATRTQLSSVDGEKGALILRGHSLEDVAGILSFEQLLALLWQDIVPEAATMDAETLAPTLGALRVRAFEKAADLLPHTDSLSLVEALRFLLSALGDDDTTSPGLYATAAAPVFTAALIRHRDDKVPISPDPNTSHAADFLHMMTGKAPADENVHALDTYWATVADHGMNASTFAARVIASTRAGIISSVVGGLCALKGPLHGGAPGPVLDMLDEIGTAENAKLWIRAALARGDRLMGFGHRIYKVRDPRADVLKAVAKTLKASGNRIPLAEAVETQVLAYLKEHKPDRSLETNVEYYTALVLDALGIPRDAFTAIFACGRVTGWVAHAYEQVETGRLIRPRSEYIGPLPAAA